MTDSTRYFQKCWSTENLPTFRTRCKNIEFELKRIFFQMNDDKYQKYQHVNKANERKKFCHEMGENSLGPNWAD